MERAQSNGKHTRVGIIPKSSLILKLAQKKRVTLFKWRPLECKQVINTVESENVIKKKTQDDNNEKPPSTWTSAEVNWLKVTAWFNIYLFIYFFWFEFHCESVNDCDCQTRTRVWVTADGTKRHHVFLLFFCFFLFISIAIDEANCLQMNWPSR